MHFEPTISLRISALDEMLPLTKKDYTSKRTLPPLRLSQDKIRKIQNL